MCNYNAALSSHWQIHAQELAQKSSESLSTQGQMMSDIHEIREMLELQVCPASRSMYFLFPAVRTGACPSATSACYERL